MPLRPIIGVAARTIPFAHRERPYPRYGCAISYCNAVEGAGGTPVLFPLTSETSVLERYFSMIDGLLLPGGQDIHPMHYGEDPVAKLDQVDPLRDLTELYLCRRALAENMPVLGICRGQQLLNVASGGTLHQDIHTSLGSDRFGHFQDFTQEWPSHGIEVEEGTILHEVTGDSKVMVNSYHHQSVKDLGEGMRVSARARDDIIEAIESPSHDFVVAVQWHPELLYAQRDFNMALFRRHVEAAGQFKHAKAE